MIPYIGAHYAKDKSRIITILAILFYKQPNVIS